MSDTDDAQAEKREAQARFTAAVFDVVNRYGVWMALHWFTQAMRGPCESQAKADAPPKQPRRKNR